MRLSSIAALVAVLGVATSAGIGFSCSGAPVSAQLIWVNPTGTAFPAAHSYIRCSESGKNTANLALTASGLGPGDGCLFTATLANVGNQPLAISVVITESAPKGDPTFSTCFSFVLSGGPPSGSIPGGGGAPYTFTIGVLASAPSLCGGAVGIVQATFTGTSPCKSSGWESPPPGVRWGPGVNLKDANLEDLNLGGLDMAGDNLQGADMKCDNLQGTDLANANLEGASLGQSDVAGANVAGANLEGTDLTYTTLSGATFHGANLQGANLEGSFVTGTASLSTNFDSANLDGINLALVTATGYILTAGATTTGATNVASCVATSGTAVYCDAL